MPRETPSNRVKSPNRIKLIGTCLGLFHILFQFERRCQTLNLHSEGFNTNHGNHHHHCQARRTPHHPHVADCKPSEEKFCQPDPTHLKPTLCRISQSCIGHHLGIERSGSCHEQPAHNCSRRSRNPRFLTEQRKV